MRLLIFKEVETGSDNAAVLGSTQGDWADLSGQFSSSQFRTDRSLIKSSTRVLLHCLVLVQFVDFRFINKLLFMHIRQRSLLNFCKNRLKQGSIPTRWSIVILFVFFTLRHLIVARFTHLNLHKHFILTYLLILSIFHLTRPSLLHAFLCIPVPLLILIIHSDKVVFHRVQVLIVDCLELGLWYFLTRPTILQPVHTRVLLDFFVIYILRTVLK